MTRPPAWTVAPDIMSVVIREWIEGLRAKVQAYRAIE